MRKSLVVATLSLVFLGVCGLTNSDSTSTTKTSEDVVKSSSIENVVNIERDANGIPLGYSDVHVDKEPNVSDGYVIDHSMLDEVTLEELYTKLENKETFVFYAGRDSCKYCHRLHQTQDFVLKDLNERLTYFNTEIDGNLTKEQFSELATVLDIEYVPFVVIIKDGEVVKDSQLPEELLDRPDYEGVKEYYEDAFNTVKELNEN